MGNSTKYHKVISSGTYEITGVANQLSYVIPYTGIINDVQVTESKNSLLSGYFSDFITEIDSGTGINIIYDVQPPVGQKIKFNYLIF